MSVIIPWTRVADLSIRPRIFSGNQEGVLGGEDLPTPRMGDRFAVDVVTSQLRQDAASRLLIAALFEALTGDASIELRLPTATKTVGLSGAVVDGAGQAGSLLAVRGAYPGSVIRRGTFFNVVHEGRSRVHMTTKEVIAIGGVAQVAIWPMLRFITADGDRCNFDRPIIEGQLLGFDKGAGFVRNRTKPLSFSIQERR